MKFSQYSIDKTEFDELKGECPINTFKVFDPSQIPLSLPLELLDKSLKVVVMGSGDSANAVYMVNLLRVDQPKNAIDQEPLIIAYHSGDSGVDLTAGFIHHGSWEGRTSYPGTGFFQAIEGSGIMNYYPYAGVPDEEYGSIMELRPNSHNYAFRNGVKFIKKG